MTKKLLFLLMALAAVSSSCFAQKAMQGNSLLWQISGNHLSKPSYLFGTIHVICQDDYVWTDKMEAALEQSDQVCFEMDMDDPNVPMQVAAGMMDNSGRKLKDYFTDKQYQEVYNYFKDSAGIDISMFQQMKPVILQTLMATRQTECTNATSYEERIMETAKKDSKEIIGLEQPAEQLAVIESLPADSVVKDILDGIEHPAGEADTYKKMVSAYRTQDITALYKLIKQSGGAGEGPDIFLDDRNKKWIARMAGDMEAKSIFFAVGAGHLPGENGVINLLKKAGYTVMPIK